MVLNSGVSNLDSCFNGLLFPRYRKAIGASSVRVLCDIKKKHSAHAVTADVSAADTAKAAHFFSADGVILTGSATGKEADREELSSVLKAVPSSLPVLIGSGVTPHNVGGFSEATGFIVGSYFKRAGDWRNQLDEGRIAALVEAVEGLERNKL